MRHNGRKMPKDSTVKTILTKNERTGEYVMLSVVFPPNYLIPFHLSLYCFNLRDITDKCYLHKINITVNCQGVILPIDFHTKCN